MKIPTIQPTVSYVIVATVNQWDSVAKKDKRVFRYAAKGYDNRWSWVSFDRADTFETEAKARERTRYIAKNVRTRCHESNVRLLKVTMNALVEQIDPVPGIVDAIAAHAVNLSVLPTLTAEMVA